MTEPPAWIGTNVFLHAQATDPHSAACRGLLRAVQAGRRTVCIDPLVVHELTYVLPRFRKGMTRDDVALYCQSVLKWPGVEIEDRSLWVEALATWAKDPQPSWTDAVLLTRIMQADGANIWTVNRDDFERWGVNPPDMGRWTEEGTQA